MKACDLSRTPRKRFRLIGALIPFPIVLAFLVGLPFAASAFDAVKEFRSWFRGYKKGEIDLYQRSEVPVAAGGSSGLRYFKTDAIRRMDDLLNALARRNDETAAKLLVDAATFRFDRRGDIEVRKYYEKQPWILRTHAAETLAKITDPKARQWMKTNLLDSRSLSDSAYRRSLGARLFSQSSDNAELLLPSLSDRDHNVRVAALLGLSRIGSISESDQVLERLQDRSAEVRVAAVEALGGILQNDQNSHPSFFDRCLNNIVPLLEDPSWSVSDAVLAFLEQFRSRRSIPILIDFLVKIAGQDDHYRARTYHRVVEVLQSLTGVTRPGSDSKEWKTWWEDNQKTFILPPERPMRIGYQSGSAHFFSIPINSDRVLFILDISGSMKAPLPRNRSAPSKESKLARARIELEQTLSELDPKVAFNIYLFNDEVEAFADNFENATELNIAAAKLFFRKAEAQGGTNLFDTLNQALLLQNLGTLDQFGKKVDCDTILLLSDGVPSTGLVINPDEIVRIIHNANRGKRIRIHTVYLGSEHSPFMEKLAEQNYGRYVHIR